MTIYPASSMAGELVKSYQIEKKVYDTCEEADKYIKRKQYKQAIQLLNSAAAYDPTSYSSAVHVDLATCYRKQKSFKKAASEARKAVEFDSKNADAVYELALCYMELKQYDRCARELERYSKIATDPSVAAKARKLVGEAIAFENLQEASKLIGKGYFNKAIKKLQIAARYDPTSYTVNIHQNLCWAYGHSGRPELAIEEGKKARKLAPNNERTLYSLAYAYQDIAKFREAQECLRQLLSVSRKPEMRTIATELLEALKVDEKQYNSADTKRADYYDKMQREGQIMRWSRSNLPLKIHIANGRGVKGYHTVYNTYIKQSMDTWCLASGKRLAYRIVDDPKKANIKVLWTDRSLDSKGSTHRVKAGLTHFRRLGTSILSAEVYVLTMQAFDLSKPVPRGQCASVCMHEIGHALGLDHSTYIYDVMYFRSSSKQTGKPTKRDRATLARLYQSYPVVAFKPKAEPLPANMKVKFRPPPTFVPPKPPDNRKITPPVFIPPPIPKKLSPPLFTPPPVSKQKREPSVPLFVPKPIKKGKPAAKKKTKPAKRTKTRPRKTPPLFTPPPPK